MVSPRLYGRLGNQMFQIAAAIGYGRQYDMEFTVPDTTLDLTKWPVYFTHFPPAPAYRPGAIVFKENGFHYNKIPKFDSVVLDGYFQSEKYFKHCRKDIIDAFQIPYIKDTEAVAVHVRRGDYLNLQQHHPTLTIDYYRRAIHLFVKEGYSLFKIFSDDIGWCKENFTNEVFGKKCLFNFVEGNTPLGDLSAMSSCAHNIIANSSFSWWAAWLNQNKEKQIISPDRYAWFGSALDHLNTADLLPFGWLTLHKPEITQ